MTKEERALLDIGIPANLSGFGFLRDALEMVKNEPEILRGQVPEAAV